MGGEGVPCRNVLSASFICREEFLNFSQRDYYKLLSVFCSPCDTSLRYSIKKHVTFPTASSTACSMQRARMNLFPFPGRASAGSHIEKDNHGVTLRKFLCHIYTFIFFPFF
uniref:Uncharacterized protein n=1 Tax=Sphaerodactylus townsendi TaxID=933632 RepID=A0ACB8EG97_9SAUR